MVLEDSNVMNINSVDSADVSSAGMYLFFSILAAFGSLATLIIIVLVLGFMLKKIGFGGFLKVGKQ